MVNLNVASSAGFMAGPKLSTYYSTKNYVLKQTMAISEELKHQNSKVKAVKCRKLKKAGTRTVEQIRCKQNCKTTAFLTL